MTNLGAFKRTDAALTDNVNFLIRDLQDLASVLFWANVAVSTNITAGCFEAILGRSANIHSKNELPFLKF